MAPKEIDGLVVPPGGKASTLLTEHLITIKLQSMRNGKI